MALYQNWDTFYVETDKGEKLQIKHTKTSYLIKLMDDSKREAAQIFSCPSPQKTRQKTVGIIKDMHLHFIPWGEFEPFVSEGKITKCYGQRWGSDNQFQFDLFTQAGMKYAKNQLAHDFTIRTASYTIPLQWIGNKANYQWKLGDNKIINIYSLLDAGFSGFGKKAPVTFSEEYLYLNKPFLLVINEQDKIRLGFVKEPILRIQATSL